MKNKLKMISILAAAALSLSVVSCDADKKSNNKKSAADNPENAVQNFIQGLLDADTDDVCNAMAPEELWDYVCKDTGLSKEKIIQRLIGGDSLEDISKAYNEGGVKANTAEIEEKHEESDDGYHAFGQVMSNAGIDENIDHLYYVSLGPDEWPYYDMDGFAYEIDDKWYFGSEWILEDFIEVAIEGYSALLEEYDYEDDDYEYQQDTLPQKQDYENNADQENNENTEHNSQPKLESVNLCADSSNWTNWSSGENDCAATLKILSDGASLEITKSHGSGGEHTYYYYNQLKYENITLEKNATYLLEFDIEATGDIGFEYCVQQNYTPYNPYVDEIVDVSSNNLKHYSIEFTMTESDDDAAIAFNLNYPDVAVPYTVSVHNLTLVRVD